MPSRGWWGEPPKTSAVESQVSSAAFPEQAELAIKRLGGTFCEHPCKGGMHLEETEVVTAHFKIMSSLVEKCDSEG